MGDVEETLSAVRQSIPGQSALVELQVTCFRRMYIGIAHSAAAGGTVVGPCHRTTRAQTKTNEGPNAGCRNVWASLVAASPLGREESRRHQRHSVMLGNFSHEYPCDTSLLSYSFCVVDDSTLALGLHDWNLVARHQEALSRKADKAYTKRKMAVLVARVSALLKEESDEPSMAKKCLSCDRAFNKLSFKDLELVQQVRTSQGSCPRRSICHCPAPTRSCRMAAQKTRTELGVEEVGRDKNRRRRQH